jgi:rhodanese-related sulfurtransferase
MKYFLSFAMALTLFACNAQQDQSNNTFSDMSNAQAKELIANQAELQIIDVRTDGEVAQGMIEGAQQIDISKPDFEKQLASLDKSKPVLVYCHSGGRSKRAQNIMKEQGFTEVHNLASGFSRWQ